MNFNDILESAAAHLRKPSIVEVKRVALGDDNNGLALVPSGWSLSSLKSYYDELKARPDRRKGNSLHRSLPSFIGWFNRHKDGNSVIFADIDPTGVTLDNQNLRGIIDYHEAGAEEIDPKTSRRARYGEFMATYPFPWSLEMQTWHSACDSSMSQVGMAEFIEKHIDDVLVPPTKLVDGKMVTQTGDPEVDKLLDRLDIKCGGPADLLALAKGISIHAEAKASQQYNHSTGESAISFSEEHKTETIRVPNLFLIAIPVFVGHDTPVLMGVHLRYRLKGGAVTWSVEIHRVDRIIRSVVGDVIATVEADTDTTVFIGKPQA